MGAKKNKWTHYLYIVYISEKNFGSCEKWQPTAGRDLVYEAFTVDVTAPMSLPPLSVDIRTLECGLNSNESELNWHRAFLVPDGEQLMCFMSCHISSGSSHESSWQTLLYSTPVGLSVWVGHWHCLGFVSFWGKNSWLPAKVFCNFPSPLSNRIKVAFTKAPLKNF